MQSNNSKTKNAKSNNDKGQAWTRERGPASYRIKPVQGDDGLVYGYLATAVDDSGRVLKSTYMTVDKVDAFFGNAKSANQPLKQAANRSSNATGMNKRNTNNNSKDKPRDRNTIKSSNNAVKVKDATGIMQTAKTSMVLGAGATLGSMAVHKIFNWFDD